MKITAFCKMVFDFYAKQGRHVLPWRREIIPYRVLVSEVMLQQTQVDRVIPKFNAWMKEFPTVRALARAPLQKVLLAWQGLGYNNRALRLKRVAEIVVRDYRGTLPREKEKLVVLPGIGPYTAGAIRAFAWDLPEFFIETNIRRVFIHHFFKNKKIIHDKEIFPLIEKCIFLKPKTYNLSPRVFYYALMDYGSYLAKTIPNPNRKSKHFYKQSTFKGSNRELRGKILRILMGKRETFAMLQKITKETMKRLRQALQELENESLIMRKGDWYCISK